MNAVITRFLEQLIIPPGGILTGLLLIIILLSRVKATEAHKHLTLAKWGLWSLFFITYFISIPITANIISDILEPINSDLALKKEDLQQTKAQAIVIFGYGRVSRAPEYDNQDTLSVGGLARIRYGAWLYRHTKLPILVAGGRPYEDKHSEARLMQKVLEEEFNTPVKWLDEDSNNTWENAANAVAILKQANITHILLVVHTRDVARALWSVQKASNNQMQVTLAPTLFRQQTNNNLSLKPADLLNLIPNASALNTISIGLHELFGKSWYQLRY